MNPEGDGPTNCIIEGCRATLIAGRYASNALLLTAVYCKGSVDIQRSETFFIFTNVIKCFIKGSVECIVT